MLCTFTLLGLLIIAALNDPELFGDNNGRIQNLKLLYNAMLLRINKKIGNSICLPNNKRVRLHCDINAGLADIVMIDSRSYMSAGKIEPWPALPCVAWIMERPNGPYVLVQYLDHIPTYGLMSGNVNLERGRDGGYVDAFRIHRKYVTVIVQNADYKTADRFADRLQEM